MSVEQYWMGKDLNLEAVWRDFDAGSGYIDKVSTSDLHMLRLTFDSPEIRLPLFNHEAIYKTVKGTFHDVKLECYSKQKYNSCAPIFLHGIRRGSGIYEFLGQLDPILTWATALGAAALGYRMLLENDQRFDETRLAFIRTEFPGASKDDQIAYMKAWTTFGRRKVLQRLIQQGLGRVEVSKTPISEKIETVPPVVVNMAVIVTLDEADN
jgi:hypothetical protein